MDRRDYFADDRHALYVGWVVGIAIKNGLEPYPELDDAGNYTDRVVIAIGPHAVVVVVPPPPDDWSLLDDASNPPDEVDEGQVT